MVIRMYTTVNPRNWGFFFFIECTHILKKWKWVHVVYPRVPFTTAMIANR
jgi:hypothetical protein